MLEKGMWKQTVPAMNMICRAERHDEFSDVKPLVCIHWNLSLMIGLFIDGWQLWGWLVTTTG